MEQLDTKFIQFLSMISRQKEIRSITELALNLGVSRRMVYYYVDKLNDFLKEKKTNSSKTKKKRIRNFKNTTARNSTMDEGSRNDRLCINSK